MNVVYARRTEMSDNTKRMLEGHLGEMTHEEFRQVVDMVEARVGVIVTEVILPIMGELLGKYLKSVRGARVKEVVDSTNKDRSLKASEVAEILGVSVNHAYDLMRSEGFPSTRIGRSIRVLERDFWEWKNKNTGRTN